MAGAHADAQSELAGRFPFRYSLYLYIVVIRAVIFLIVLGLCHLFFSVISSHLKPEEQQSAALRGSPVSVLLTPPRCFLGRCSACAAGGEGAVPDQEDQTATGPDG